MVLLTCASAGNAEFLPAGHRLFDPLLADPTAPAATVRVLSQVGGRTFADINIGDEFGLVSSGAGTVQLGIAAGITGRFDISTATRDFEVADFTLMIPLDAVFGRLSLRAAYQHISSHLGDDYLDRTHAPDPKRTVDEVRATVSLPFAPGVGTALRLYAGGGIAFSVLPEDVGTGRLQCGLELSRGSLFAATDLQLLERARWQLAFTARAGLMLRGSVARLSIFVEYFTGPQPYLAFLENSESRVALGLSLSR